MSEWKNQVVPHWLAKCMCCDRNCLSSPRGQVRAFAGARPYVRLSITASVKSDLTSFRFFPAFGSALADITVLSQIFA